MSVKSCKPPTPVLEGELTGIFLVSLFPARAAQRFMFIEMIVSDSNKLVAYQTVDMQRIVG
jgi:hypothetical protein